MAFGVLTVLWALFIYGYASQPGTVFGTGFGNFGWVGYAPLSHSAAYFRIRFIGGAWAILTAGLLVIGSRAFFPTGAQTRVDGAAQATS